MTDLSLSLDRKFIDTIELSNGFSIKTEEGFKPLTHIHKTIEYDVWYVETESGKNLRCADTHIVFDDQMRQTFVEDLKENESYIQTCDGIEKIVRVYKTQDDQEHMFDLTVDSENHSFYSNDILSHNSQTFAAYICWLILFNDNHTVAILANKLSTAKEILERVKLAYEHLPPFLQIGISSWNKTGIEIENKSRVIASSTSGSAARGMTINTLILDEFAFVNNNIADDFFTSVYPTIASGKKSKIIITSTPNGMNHFHTLWKEAVDGKNGFAHVKVTWEDVDHYDEAWKEDTIKTIGEQKFTQEFSCQFLGSQNTLIASKVLATLSSDKPISSDQSLIVYKEPIKQNSYIIVCDPSRGTGNDYSAFVVFDITQYPFTISAVYHDSSISPVMLPLIIKRVAEKYNNAQVLIEINDNGQQVADILWDDLEYENTIILKDNKIPGVRTTKSVKRYGCSLLKDMIETYKLIINDEKIINELINFTQTIRGWEAEQGKHDDLVMCLVLFAWYCSTDDFLEDNTIGLKQSIMETTSQSEAERALPDFFRDDGLFDSEDFDTDISGFFF